MLKNVINFLKSKFLWVNIAVAFVLLFALGFCVLSFLQSYTRHGEFVIVPDLNNLYENEAEVILKDSCLKYEIVDSVYLRGEKAGAIVEQTPKAGAKVKKNRIIFLTVNTKEKKQVEVPNDKIIGRSEDEAKQNLINRGFMVEVEYLPSKYDDEVLDVKYRGQSITDEIYSGEQKSKRVIPANTKLDDGAMLTIIVGKKSADYVEDEHQEAADEDFF